MTTPTTTGQPLNPLQRTAVALAAAIAIAAPFEGLRNYAYLDPVGIPTICYGSIEGVRLGQYRSTPECVALLTVEMRQRIETVDRCVPGLPINMLAAWASAIFNTGRALVCNTLTSTAARLLAAGKLEEACRQLPRWNMATLAGKKIALPGLTRRRAAEMELCLKP